MISSFSAAESLDMQTVVTDVFYHLHLFYGHFPQVGHRAAALLQMYVGVLYYMQT